MVLDDPRRDSNGGSMMVEERNTSVVREMYEALARGDIAAVLNHFYNDAVLEVHGPSSIPFAGRFLGRSGLEAFFQVVGHHTERPTEEHIPKLQELIAQGDKVVAIGVDRVLSRSTWRTYEGWWVHVIELRDGRVTRLREYVDTAAASEVFRIEADA
jgi:ketosteroid isomerase-like protein